MTTDACATPGCGHAKNEHWDGRLQCFDGLIGHCKSYLPPRPVPEEAGLTSDAQARRDLWREAAEKGIDQGVDWPRIVLTLFDDIDRLTATVPAPHAEAEAAEAWRAWSWLHEVPVVSKAEMTAFMAGWDARGRGDRG